MAAALVIAALAVVGLLMSCGKEREEPSPLPVMPTLDNLSGTEWEGTYLSSIDYQGTEITMKLVWTVDFLTDTSGSLLVEVSSAFSQTEYNDFGFTYSYDGVSEGLLYSGGEAETFVVDAVNQTITMDMQMPVGLGDEGQQTVLGGETVLYRIR